MNAPRAKWITCLNCGHDVFWVYVGGVKVVAHATGYPVAGGEMQCTGCFEVGRAVLPDWPIPEPEFEVLKR